jgi:hypothetical protein
VNIQEPGKRKTSTPQSSNSHPLKIAKGGAASFLVIQGKVIQGKLIQGKVNLFTLGVG